VQPQIGADDVSADGKAIKMMIAMGAGLPEHYLAEGGNVNYATATEMGLPTFRKFQRRQDEFVLVIRAIVDRVLDEAVTAGALPASANRAYKVVVPELAPDDNKSLAQSAKTMAEALSEAYALGWISRASAMQAFFAAGNLPLDLKEELDRIDAEGAERARAGDLGMPSAPLRRPQRAPAWGETPPARPTGTPRATRPGAGRTGTEGASRVGA